MMKKLKRINVEEFSQHWSQYKNNPHIERNNVTKEFRCNTCKIDLGDNAGGAGGHSKGSHQLRLNGTSLIPEKPLVKKRVNIIPTRQRMPTTTKTPAFISFNEIRSKYPKLYPSGPSEVKTSIQSNISYSDLIPNDEITKYDRLYERYMQAVIDGKPEPILRQYRYKLGLKDPPPKKDEELESLKEILPVYYMKALQSEEGLRELQNILFLIELRKQQIKH